MKTKEKTSTSSDIINIESFNDTARSFQDEVVIQQLFESQVDKQPDSIAVIFDHDTFTGSTNLTYHQLNQMVNQVARKLRSHGVQPDQIVGLMVDRSFAMIVGILGIIKAGGAYLPIAPEYPPERVKYMLTDSDTKVLLVQDKTSNQTAFDGITINLEDKGVYLGESNNLPILNNPTDLAYVIYTSGSTGKPKGVMIEHRSLINRLNWMQNSYPIGTNDVILQKTPFNFDVSVWELIWWTFQGAKMCLLMPGAEKFPFAIIDTIKKHKISVMHFVPSMLNVFLEYLREKDPQDIKAMSCLKQVFVSGETLTPSHVMKYNQIFRQHTNAKLTNLYGPTEATVDVTYFDCPTRNEIDKIYIGKPIDNIKIHILKKGQLQAVGKAGELCISGVGVARGYLNNSELTKERFVQNPLNPEERMYKTGDIARWSLDGNIEYLGREDHQVKIRGLRIELGEIESVIRKHASIKDCLINVKHYSENVILIIAYVVPVDNLKVDELKEYLKKYLPEYMIPNHFEIMDAIPLSYNGKADRKALPEPILIFKK